MIADRLGRAFTTDGLAGLEHELEAAMHELLEELSTGDVVTKKATG